MPDTARVRVPVPAGYDHGWVLRFLRPRAIPGVEMFDQDTYIRAVRVGSGIHVLTLAAADAGFQASITPPLARSALLRIARTMVGADDDLDAFRAHAANDQILGPLVAQRPGVRLIRFPDAFEGMVRAIFGQQVSLAAAATTGGRLAALLGEAVYWNGHALHGFPSALAVAEVAANVIRSIGLTRAKNNGAAGMRPGDRRWGPGRAAPGSLAGGRGGCGPARIARHWTVDCGLYPHACLW